MDQSDRGNAIRQLEEAIARVRIAATAEVPDKEDFLDVISLLECSIEDSKKLQTAIRELQTTITELQAANKHLKAENVKLTADVTALTHTFNNLKSVANRELEDNRNIAQLSFRFAQSRMTSDRAHIKLCESLAKMARDMTASTPRSADDASVLSTAEASLPSEASESVGSAADGGVPVGKSSEGVD